MTSPSTDLVPEGTYGTGLEDLTQSDITIPRLRLRHKLALFEDPAAGIQMPKLVCVILGLVRQRVLFHYDVEDDDQPMCKSFNFQLGWPGLDPKKPKLNFPWEKAGFNPVDFPPDEQGLISLPCTGCKLKDWGSHPVGEKPYCSEQFTLPIYYADSAESIQSGDYSSALITFQKTSLNPLRKYLSQFQTRQVGAYTVYTEIGLDQRKRGQTDYCVATFRNLGATDPENHPEFSDNYGAIRTFLTTAKPAPRILPNQGDDVSYGTSGVAAAQPVPVTPAEVRPAVPTPNGGLSRPPLGQPAPVPATVHVPANVVEAQVVEPDDDLPF